MSGRGFGHKNKRLFKVIISGMIALVCLIPPTDARGASTLEERPLEEGSVSELTYLLSFVGSDAVNADSFLPERISQIIEFVLKPKNHDVLYHAQNINGAASAYHEVDIDRGIEEVLRVAYSPDIPAFVARPSVMRLSNWNEINSPGNRLPKLWELISDLQKPRIFTGLEHIVNAPDDSTGAYFEYDLYRTLILMKLNERVVLISLSKQNGVSGVGKKGIVIGPHENWDYLYTGLTGTNIAGLGWVAPHMYDSLSVSFYCEMADERPTVRYSTFKWLRGGALGLNLVSSKDIHRGLIRFDAEIKQILENHSLTNMAKIEKELKAIQNLPGEDLMQMARDYLLRLEKRSTTNGLILDKQAAALLVGQKYLHTLNRSELQAFVILEYMKQVLNHAVDQEPLHHGTALDVSGESKKMKF